MSTKQQTLKAPISFSGKGLHTGVKVTMTVNPAEAGTGIVFRRTDLEGQPIIPALCDNVVDTSRGTTVEAGGHRVHTIEHIMSALWTLGVDNAVIDIDAPETPIMDGSAREYARAITETGLADQDAERQFYHVTEKMVYTIPEKGVAIILYPDDEFSVSVHVDYNSKVIGNQYATFNPGDDFARKISPCRTFVFLHELEPLINMNLIKGGDLDNAIVVVENPVPDEQLDKLKKVFNKPDIEIKAGYLNNLELRCNNELARHKLLDLLGDFALLGVRIKGRVWATRPGHFANTEFMKQLKQTIRRGGEKPRYTYDCRKPPLYDINDIRRMLPHRPPFLLVDRMRFLVRGGHQERDDERTVLRGPLPRGAGDAGRADRRGHGAVQRHHGLEQRPRPGELLDLLYEDRRREIQAQGRSGRHAAIRNPPAGTHPPGRRPRGGQGVRRRDARLRGRDDGAGSQKQKIEEMISNLAYIHPDAKLGANVTVEPFAYIAGDTVIGDDCWIGPGAVIHDGARIGKRCRIHTAASVACLPQDLKFAGEITTCEIGDDNDIREYVTISRGTASTGTTRIGSKNLLMAYVHIGHDCIIGSNCVIANRVSLAGEVHVGDWVVIGGHAAVHQWTHIGAHAMVQGGALLGQDLPPYVIVRNDTLRFAGINKIGLARRGFSHERIAEIHDACRILFQSGLNYLNGCDEVEKQVPQSPERDTLLEFIRTSKRGIIKPYESRCKEE